MADKNPREMDLALAVHRAENGIREAKAQPASAGRVDRINRAHLEHSKAVQAHDHHMSGQASPMKSNAEKVRQ